MPSPPPIPPQLLMPATTFASPTDVRITRDGGNLAARSSIIRDVERFVARSPCPCLCKSRMTPRTSVYSSPINFPCSSTSASRSASGSCAHPIATELAARTASDNWPRFASIGSGVWANDPVCSPLRCTTSHPSASSNIFPARDPPPLTLSSTTRNFFERIEATSTFAKTLSTCT